MEGAPHEHAQQGVCSGNVTFNFFWKANIIEYWVMKGGTFIYLANHWNRNLAIGVIQDAML